MLRNKLLKRVLFITIMVICLMSLGMGVFADGNTVPRTIIVNHTYMG